MVVPSVMLKLRERLQLIRFTGKEAGLSRLYYMRGRCYNPQSGASSPGINM